MAILQLDLRVLKELGYPGDSATSFRLPQVADSFVIRQPVERILRQKAEREATEKAEAEREAAEKVEAERKAAEKAGTEASSNSSTPEMEIPTSGTQPEIPPPHTAIPAPQADTGSEQTLKSSHGAGHRPSNHPVASPQPAPPPPPSKPVPPALSPDIPEPSPKPGPPSITPLGHIGTSL